MASLTLITIAFVVNVLAIWTQTCTCGLLSSLSPAHLYTEASFPPKKLGQGSVIYVPSPVGHLPLEDHGHNYHLQLGLGKNSYLHASPTGKDFHSAISTGHYQQQHLSSTKELSSGHHGGYQHLDSISSKNHHHSGSAKVFQKNDHHSSEQKQQINHGHGVSHQTVKQEHQQGYQDLSSQVHDHGYGHDELHNKKDHDAHYNFEYSVNDYKTGDVKRHREERKGDVVNGEYSLLEEDGNVRTVKYYADWKSGFHAQVHNTKPRIK